MLDQQNFESQKFGNKKYFWWGVGLNSHYKSGYFSGAAFERRVPCILHSLKPGIVKTDPSFKKLVTFYHCFVYTLTIDTSYLPQPRSWCQLFSSYLTEAKQLLMAAESKCRQKKAQIIKVYLWMLSYCISIILIIPGKWNKPID